MVHANYKKEMRHKLKVDWKSGKARLRKKMDGLKIARRQQECAIQNM